MWELVLLHKTAITVFAFAVGDVPDVRTTGLIDLGVVLTAGLAYVLCRGWYAWRTTAPEPVSAGRPAHAAG